MRSGASCSTSSAQVLGQSWGQTDGTKIEFGHRANFQKDRESTKLSHMAVFGQSALPYRTPLVIPSPTEISNRGVDARLGTDRRRSADPAERLFRHVGTGGRFCPAGKTSTDGGRGGPWRQGRRPARGRSKQVPVHRPGRHHADRHPRRRLWRRHLRRLPRGRASPVPCGRTLCRRRFHRRRGHDHHLPVADRRRTGAEAYSAGQCRANRRRGRPADGRRRHHGRPAGLAARHFHQPRPAPASAGSGPHRPT